MAERIAGAKQGTGDSETAKKGVDRITCVAAIVVSRGIPDQHMAETSAVTEIRVLPDP
jgi:hypothetical protein